MSTVSDIKTCWLTVNSSCQLRCAWCYAKDRDYDPKGDMAHETAIRLIDIMGDLGVQTCKILGGEPSIYPHIVPVLKRLKQRSIRSVIITNGIRYSDRAVMQRHFEAGLDNLIISLKAGSQATYKELTGAPVLDSVHRAVKNLQEFRGGVTITITQEMQNEIILAISDVVAVGARFINLHFCSPTVMSGAPENHSMIAPDKAATVMMIAVEHLEKLGVSYNVQISLPFCLFERGFIEGLMQKNCLTSGCIVNKKSGIIFGSEGEAGFCNHMMDYPFGRLGADFTTAAELQKLYGEQDEFFAVTNRAPDARCVECPMSNLCCGGCPLQWTQFDPQMYVKGGEFFTLPLA